MEDPEDLTTLDSIRKLTNLNPEILVAGKTAIENARKWNVDIPMLNDE